MNLFAALSDFLSGPTFFAGRWLGTYHYDPPAVGVPADFELVISPVPLGGFVGSVRDLGEAGMPDEGLIEGRIWGTRVSFTKQMPRCFIGPVGGRAIPLSEYEMPDGAKPFADAPHPLLRYVGTLGAERATASGRWKLDETVVYSKDRRQAFPFPGCTGTWMMARDRAPGTS